MTVKKSVERYNEAAAALGAGLYNALMSVPEAVKCSTNEIRLRIGAPIILRTSSRIYFLGENGHVSEHVSNPTKILKKADIEESFVKLCEYSVYSHQNDIANGFITVKGGHRAGICGTAVIENGNITAVRNVSSINFRIARQINGIADEICKKVFDSGVCNVMIAGAPSSGKTTVLRDMVRWMSQGSLRISIVDERSEIAATYRGISGNDIGFGCDILNGYPKAIGINHAVRCMSPDFIVCDEIGSEEDVQAIERGVNSGVGFVMGIHAANESELYRKHSVSKLIEIGAVDKIVLLEGRNRPGICKSIIEISKTNAKACGF